MIDARRMEVYTTFFDSSMRPQGNTSAEIIQNNSFGEILNQHKVWFFGNGAAKCRDSLKHPNANFISHQIPLATSMAVPAFEAWQKKNFEDVAYFEPFYLKDFIATIPKRKVL